MTKLVKQTENKLSVPQDVIIDSILSGEVSTIEDLVEIHGLSLLEATKLCASVEFNQILQHYSKGKSNLYFHTKGIKKVLDIANTSDDNKEVMQAMKFIAQYTGNSKNEGTDVNVNLNLGSLIDKADDEKKVSSIDLIDFEKLN